MTGKASQITPSLKGAQDGFKNRVFLSGFLGRFDKKTTAEIGNPATLATLHLTTVKD